MVWYTIHFIAIFNSIIKPCLFYLIYHDIYWSYIQNYHIGVSWQKKIISSQLNLFLINNRMISCYCVHAKKSLRDTYVWQMKGHMCWKTDVESLIKAWHWCSHWTSVSWDPRVPTSWSIILAVSSVLIKSKRS